MTEDKMLKSFKSVVCSEIRIVTEGQDRFHIFTPFRFNDGDRYVIILKKKDNEWILSDEAHTFMHISYRLDIDYLSEGTRSEIIDTVKNEFFIEEDDGELFIKIRNEGYGHALFNFLQAISKIYDTLYLSRDRVISAFIEDLKDTIQEIIPQDKVISNWHDPNLDPEGKYAVDYKIDGGNVPVFVFALNSNKKIDDATITILWYEQKGVKFYSIGMYENQEKNSRKSVARFTDVSSRSFSTLSGNTERFEKTLIEQSPSLATAC